MTALGARQARRRYLVLIALRWLPTGLLIPVTTLLALDRGLTVAEVGLALSAQGVVVALLELPTGGLADALGRRPVLVLAGVAGTVSLALLAVADSLAGFAAAWACQGLFRALDSGPLESWYVDTARAAEPGLRLDRALSAGATVLCLAVAVGAVAAGALVAVTGDPLVPVLGALALQVAGILAPLALSEPRPARGRLRSAVVAVPSVVVDGLATVWRSAGLAGLTAVALLWGVGMVAFETLLPVRTAELTGGPAAAAVLLGPAVAGAWLVSAAGAAAAPWLAARTGPVGAAVLCRLLQGGAVVAMGLVAGPAGLLSCYLLTYVVHGAANPLHAALLHEQVDAGRRTTVQSVTSLASQLGFAVGLVGLTALADATTTGTAIVTGGAVLALAAPLYLPSRRRVRRPIPASGLRSRPAGWDA